MSISRTARVILAALIAAAACATMRLAGAASAPAGPDSLIVGLDLRGDHGRVDRMARQLLSGDAGAWRQAQARLANAGPTALAAIERAHVLDDPRGGERVRELLTGALRLSLTPAELYGHDALSALVREPIAKGYAIAETLAMRKHIWCGPCGPPRLWDDMPLPPPTTTDRMVELDGCAVPAAAAMLRDARPVARYYGLVVLGSLGATSALDSIRALLADGATVGRVLGDVSDRESVGDKARATLSNLRVVSEAPYGFESRALGQMHDLAAQSLLIGGIRTSSRALAVRSWDDWWREAGPAWSEWWRLTGDGVVPGDEQAWRDFIDELDGCRLRIGSDPAGRARLSITGPPGTTCRVILVRHPDSTLIASGPVPIQVAGEAKADSTRPGAEATGGRIGTQGALLVEAALPGGRRWSRMFAWQPDSRLQIELLATVRRGK